MTLETSGMRKAPHATRKGTLYRFYVPYSSKMKKNVRPGAGHVEVSSSATNQRRRKVLYILYRMCRVTITPLGESKVDEKESKK